MRMKKALEGFPHLLAFLTTIPLPCHEFKKAAEAFPLVPVVGLIEGVIVVLIIQSCIIGGVCAPLIAALALIAHGVLTGCLHLDGFADYVDVIGSRRAGEEALRILKDPRRGSFSIVWVAVQLIVKYAALEVLCRSSLLVLPLVVTACYVASAEAMYISSLIGRSSPYEGLGKIIAARARDKGSIILNAASLVPLTLAFSVMQPKYDWLFAALVGMGIVAGVLVAIDANRRLGFVSGDVLGFAYEISHTLTLLASAIIAVKL